MKKILSLVSLLLASVSLADLNVCQKMPVANATSHQWVSAITPGGATTLSQPAFTDISGSVAAAQLPNPSASSLGGTQSYAAVVNQWINAISTSGVPSSTQPAFSNLSGSVAASQMPAHTGDVTSSAGSVATTVAAIQGTTVSGTTGSTNVVFSKKPAITSPITTAVADFVATGTTTNNASTTLTGSGTAFLSELDIGDRVSLSSASSTFAYVNSRASNTSVGLSVALGDGTSQTINVKKMIARMDATAGAAVGTTSTFTDLGFLLIGSYSAQDTGIAATTSPLQVRATGNPAVFSRYSNDTTGPALIFRKSRSATILTPSVITTGDAVGAFTFTGASSATAYTTAVSLIAGSEGTISSGVIPGTFTIGTANSSGTVTTAFFADSSQHIFMANVGTVTAGTNGAACFSSSGQLGANTANCIVSLLKFKTEIETMDPEQSLKTVNTLAKDAIYYRYTDEYLGGSAKQVHASDRMPGFGAEWVEKDDPRYAMYNSDGKLSGVRYEQMAATNASAISALTKRDEAKSAAIADLSSKLVAMQAQIDQLKKGGSNGKEKAR